MQRPPVLASGQGGIRTLCLLTSFFDLCEDDRIQRRVVLLHTLEVELQQFHRADFLVPNFFCQRQCRLKGKFCHVCPNKKSASPIAHRIPEEFFQLIAGDRQRCVVN